MRVLLGAIPLRKFLCDCLRSGLTYSQFSSLGFIMRSVDITRLRFPSSAMMLTARLPSISPSPLLSRSGSTTSTLAILRAASCGRLVFRAQSFPRSNRITFMTLGLLEFVITRRRVHRPLYMHAPNRGCHSLLFARGDLLCIVVPKNRTCCIPSAEPPGPDALMPHPQSRYVFQRDLLGPMRLYTRS